jgi:hypothetical protein
METTQLMNDVENMVFGKVKDTILDIKAVMLGDANQTGWPVLEGHEFPVTIYEENLPPIGERVAICTRGVWMTESDFVKTVAAVAEMLGKLDPLSDETRRRLVNMVLRHQMDAARVVRREKQAR